MCDECRTRLVRVLVPEFVMPGGLPWHYTLRFGEDGILIVGPQDAVAHFDIFEAEEVVAVLRVDDPVEWVGFLPAYARSLGKSDDDYYEIIADLESEASALAELLVTLASE
ncbi:MAG: hypothetical protein V1738_03005 [Patescibacteria group bacterium]